MKPRQVIITYALSVAFEVPEDFPVTAKEIQETADRHCNDFTDGRHPFSTELMHEGAERAGRGHLMAAIDAHYCRRIDKAFPPNGTNVHMAARIKIIDRAQAKVRPMGIPEHQVPVHVAISPSTVVCPGCGQETPTSWRECFCSPGVLLPGLEPRQGERRRPARPDVYPPREC